MDVTKNYRTLEALIRQRKLKQLYHINRKISHQYFEIKMKKLVRGMDASWQLKDLLKICLPVFYPQVEQMEYFHHGPIFLLELCHTSARTEKLH